MEKSWNIKKMQNVMEFYDQLWNFSNFAPGFDQICALFGYIKKFNIRSECLHFHTFSSKNSAIAKFEQRVGLRELRNGHI